MNAYLLSVLTLGVIFAIFSLGLNVRWGWAGELDLAYFAFIALGAYTDAVITLPPSNLPPPNAYILGLHQHFLVGALGAMLVCGAFSVVLGAIALRKLRGDYFAIVTVAAASILAATISQFTPLFNGFAGVFGLDQPFADQLNLDADTYPWFYLGLCVLALALVYIVLHQLYHSPFGRTLRAIRENELAATAFGRNIYVEKLKAYVIGGMVAGLGGSLMVHFLTAFNPASWSTTETFLLYAAIFVGGSGSLRGVVAGTFIVLVLFQELTRQAADWLGQTEGTDALRFVLVGLLIIAVLRWRPQGLLPEAHPKDQRADGAASLRPSQKGGHVTQVRLKPAGLEVVGLTKSFGGVHAVRNCSFTVEAGTVTGLIGPNGAGKSTAIDLIAGFIRANAGQALLDGRDLMGRPPHRIANAGLMRTFQTPREWGGLTVMENMLLATPQEGRSGAWRALLARPRLRRLETEDRMKARTILADLQLLEHRDFVASSLSAGQKRLLEFARIMQARPRVVLLDEPLAGVNPVLARHIAEAILGLKASGITVLLVEHNLPFIEEVCDVVNVMSLGTCIATGSMAELRKKPDVIDAYLGQLPAVV
jgi:ABC-type branched-subunit amino acid transport system ATPase component/ABC-type branched-subunit amino acid transport system permease subunit